jgi:inner membrane protein
MASIGHLAVGMMAARLQSSGDGPGPAGARSGCETARTNIAMCLVFALLGVLPDADLLVVAMGLSDSSITTGHRGASHSLAVAIALGGAGALLARRLGYGVARTALAVMLAVGSHGVIDAFGEGGRGIPLLWPISDHRFMAPWFLRFLPDAPRGMKFISRTGLARAVTEFVYFLPLTIYALKPWRPLLPELAAPSSDENPRERLPEHPSEGRAQGRSDGRSDDRSDDRSDGHEPPRRASGG